MSPEPAGHDLPTASDIAALRALCEDLARRTAARLRDHRPDRVEVLRTKSSATDVVTAADADAEAFLRREISAARPDDAVLGEEEGATAGTSGLTWVVDPIDGTVNYLYGLPSYSVSVAVVSGAPHPDRWTILAGAVHDVVADVSTSAGLGLGAATDGRRLTMSDGVDVGAMLVGTGFGYDPVLRAAQGRSAAALLEHVRDLRRIGSAALDLCRVASGQLDAYYEEALGPWDHAAGDLVVREAGGMVVGVGGAAPDHRMLLAGSKSTVAVLGPLLEQAGVGARVQR